MRRFIAIASIAALAALAPGCALITQNPVKECIPELKKLSAGAHELGSFRRGQVTPFRMLPVVNGAPVTVNFVTEPESRQFSIVFDDGRSFRFDDETDRAALAATRLDRQSFLLEFRQDMRMTVVVAPRSAVEASTK